MNLRWGLNRVINNRFLECNDCFTGSIQDLSNLTVSLSEDLVAIAVEQCSCDLSTDAFEETSLTCSSSNGRQITFSTAIVYSTQTGDITASSIADSLQLWFIRNQKPVPYAIVCPMLCCKSRHSQRPVLILSYISNY